MKTRFFKAGKYATLGHEKHEELSNISTQARTLAGLDQPPENMNSYSVAEENAISTGLNHMAKQNEKNEKIIEALNSTVAQKKMERYNNGPSIGLNNTEASYEDFIAQVAARFNQYKRKIKTSKDALNTFRLNNSITRNPRSRGKLHTIVALIIITVLVISETVLNGSILGPVLPGGTNEGLSIALVIAVINVFGSFGAGLFILPQFSHTELKMRVIGYFGALSYLFLIAYVNLSAGVFRSIAENKLESGVFSGDQFNIPAVSAGEVAQQLGFWPFDQLDILTFQSQLFISMGLIFALVSIIDGYFFDDSYPGYGALGRDLEKDEDDLKKGKKNVFRELKNIDESFNSLNSQAAKSRTVANKEWRGVIEAIDHTFTNYDVMKNQVEESINHCINEFQKLNLMFRNDGVTPKYFNGDEYKLSNKLNKEIVFSQIYSEYLPDIEATKAHDDYNDMIQADQLRHSDLSLKMFQKNLGKLNSILEAY